jgi:hypothetical protein
VDDLPEGFDSGYYLLAHGDVGEAGVDPVDHYLQHGRREGRTGVPPPLGYSTERETYDRANFFIRAFSAITMNGIDGPYLEFGVGRGLTLWLAWRASRSLGLTCPLWAFDSFKGLPEASNTIDTSHPAWFPGRYEVSEADVRQNIGRLGVDLANVHFVSGLFRESLAPERRGTLPAQAALVYVDCDLYESTVDVLDYLGGVLDHGTIIGFDDYFCWSPRRKSGEQIALSEFVASRPDLTFNPYLPIGWHGMSFFVSTDS